MAGFNVDKDRKVIPRWRSFSDVLGRRELESVAPPQVDQTVHFDYLAQKIVDWRRHKTVGHASDLVGAALTLGREQEAIEAARFLLQDNLSVSPWVRELAERASRPSNNIETTLPRFVTVEELREQVKTLKYLLRIEPCDPITWVELSRAYAIQGQNRQADRSMTVALQLAMNNRFVLRSASRLWVHLNDIEKAHDVLINADRTRYEPWLLAAEIALSGAAERKPKFIKAARRMLTERRYPPIHISELASAVGTLELQAGSVRKSKKLFRLSLEDPTENSVAQVAWVSRQYNTMHLEDRYLALPNAFEAKSWDHYKNSEWENTVEQCERWQFDQPFSSRPSGLGSYVAAVALEDYELSKQFAERGLVANPVDFILLNNLAFACINLQDFDRAKESLSKVNRSTLSDVQQAILQATEGLLEYRNGDVLRGRRLYSDARTIARRIKNDRLYALASAFYAIEEASHEGSDSNIKLSEIHRTLKNDNDPILKVLEKRLNYMTKISPTKP